MILTEIFIYQTQTEYLKHVISMILRILSQHNLQVDISRFLNLLFLFIKVSFETALHLKEDVSIQRQHF